MPSCPGWSITGLVAHVGSYHRWAADLLRDVSQRPRAPYSLEPDAALAEWYQASLDLLLDLRSRFHGAQLTRLAGEPGRHVLHLLGAHPFMPGWYQAVATWNPFNPVLTAGRAALRGTGAGRDLTD